MNILFIEPKSPANHVFSMVNIPRLGAIILATIMRDLGHTTEVLVESISGDVRDSDLEWADLVAISTITSTAPRAYSIGDRAVNIRKTVVFGGPHVTFLPAEALDHGHFVIRGEGEEALPELIKVFETGGILSSVTGLSYRREGELIDNPPRPLVEDLDRLPIPDFSLVRGWDKGKGIVPVATSRGCPFNCKFCSVVPMFGRRMRYHSVDRIIAEIERNGHGARHVFFCDDNFAADPQRAKKLLRKMIGEKLRVKWSTQVRVDAARDQELLRLMKQANCTMVYIGFESINPKTLKAVRKHQTIAQMRRSIRIFHQHGIRIHGMFVVGADDDLPGSVIQTMRFARRMKIDSAQFLMLTPLPGTETFRELEDSGRLLTREWNLYDGSYAVFRPRLMTAYDLQTETFRAYRRFYSWASVAGRALRFDLFYLSLRIYARLIVIRARRRVKEYKKKLHSEILDKAMARFGDLTGRPPRPREVLLADTVDDPYRLFLESFLGRLGMKVQMVSVRNLKSDLEKRLRAVRNRTWVLVVPLVEGVGDAGRKGQESLRSLRQGLEDSLPESLRKMFLHIDLGTNSLYQEAVELGLMFSGSLRRIRRAYRFAMEEAGL